VKQFKKSGAFEKDFDAVKAELAAAQGKQGGSLWELLARLRRLNTMTRPNNGAAIALSRKPLIHTEERFAWPHSPCT
jgi:hypothetical protein